MNRDEDLVRINLISWTKDDQKLIFILKYILKFPNKLNYKNSENSITCSDLPLGFCVQTSPQG